MAQCVATTASGAPCKAPAMNGGDRCVFHTGKHIGMVAKRPDEALINQLCAVLRTGNYINVACRAVGISHDTLNRWMQEDGDLFDELRTRVEQARSQGEVRNVALISEAATTNWQAAAWMLERQYPDRWGRTSVRLRDPLPTDSTEQDSDTTDPFAEVDELAAARARRTA